MGLFFRQAFKFGPIRLNLSKSGVGISTGVTGLRVGVRPDGRQYVHGGRYGLYYRKNLNGKDAPDRYRASFPADLSEASAPDVVYETASANELGTTSSNELLQHLQRSTKLPRTDVGVLVGTTFLVALLILVDVKLSCIIGAAGLIVSALVHKWEMARRELALDFAMDVETLNAYRKLVDGLNELAKCSAVWMHRKTTFANGHQQKVNAGASRLVERIRIQVGSTARMPWIQCDFPIPILKCGRQVNYFLPNGIYVFEGKDVGHVAYEELRVTGLGTQRHIESGTVPTDAEVVDQTWRYANKDGGRDRRFSNNHQIPVCLYGQLEVTSVSRLHWRLETSNAEAADRCADKLQAASHDLASAELPPVVVGTE